MYSIVIADDEKNIRDSISKIISLACPNVVVEKTFENGEECYNYLLNHRVDIIITDIRLPLKTGLQITDMVKRVYPSTKIIIITAYHEFEYAKLAFEYKVTDFIVKPFASKKLANTINEICTKLTEQNNIDTDAVNQYLNDWKFKRKLFLSVYLSNDIKLDLNSYNDMLLCCSTNSIKNLKCFIITVKVDKINPKNETCIIDLSEMDNHYITIFYMESTIKEYILLSFSQNILTVENTCKDICSGINNFLNCDASFEINEFDNFTKMHNYLLYKNIMDLFFSELLTNNLIVSIKSIESALLLMTNIQKNDFYYFLVKNYKIVKNDTCQNISSDVILSSIQYIAEKHLSRMQDNYPVQKIKNFLENNYSNPDISLELIAESLNISSGHLSRIFKKYFGDSYTSCINSYRMKKACELLETTNLSLNDISLAIGFRYESYFRLSFKKFTGFTPSQYRILHYKNQ